MVEDGVNFENMDLIRRCCQLSEQESLYTYSKARVQEVSLCKRKDD
jgi:hypothetical protein